ncbi:MAG: hypothetical protein DHS20C21_13740 [Gemmatimonadota bacterium]|nr:MAG: hypothetical protein DHS20C21_13740 [Gemmatimonadota bacterium]
MIAIECLLCKRGDKFSDLFPKRLTSLFGWLDEDNRDTWSKIAERLYSLRCSLVHDGLSGDITVADLLNSDAVLGNLQDNIWMNLTRFPTKDSLLRYLDEVQARHLLGMRVWRKKDNLVFHHRPITDRQIILLEEYFEVGA